ncbi:MAG: hypothetical protein MHPSP_000390, partial [Paramarteilia canceri]
MKVEDIESFTKKMDILDVWFDSSLTWDIVLNESEKKNILMIEGIDQARGWFQSIILTSTALGKSLPASKIIAHGHITDKTGEKLSKSNTFNISEIIEQAKIDSNTNPDVLRFLSLSSDFTKTKELHEQSLTDSKNKLHKIRKVLQFMANTLYKNKAPNNCEINDFRLLYALNKTNELILTTDSFYSQEKFFMILSDSYNFLRSIGSSFLINSTKRDLTYGTLDIQNRILFTYKYITSALCQILYPIIPLTIREIREYMKMGDHEFNYTWPAPLDFRISKSLKDDMDLAFQEINSLYLPEAKKFETDSNINTLEAIIEISNVKLKQFSEIYLTERVMQEIINCSKVSYEVMNGDQPKIKFNISDKFQCTRCCLHTADSPVSMCN